MNDETDSECSEGLPCPWCDEVEAIRLKVEEQAPEHLHRFDDLNYLRARLLDCEDVMETFVLGRKPGDLLLWGVFDPVAMNEAIAVLRTLPTVPADLKYYNVALPGPQVQAKDESADDCTDGRDGGDEGQEAVNTRDPWSRRIEDVKAKWSKEAPQRLQGLEDLVKFRSDASLYVDAIESSILGYHPEDPYPEAVFGDSVLEGTIEAMGGLSRTVAELGLETGVIQKLIAEAQDANHRNGPEACTKTKGGYKGEDGLVAYDNHGLDIAMIETGESHVRSVPLENIDGVILSLATAEPCSRVVSIAILGGGAECPFWADYYNPETDTLLIGTQLGASVTVHNGDITSYWQFHPESPEDSYVPLGVEVFQAKKWLGRLAQVSAIPRSTALKWGREMRATYSGDVDILYVSTRQEEVEGAWEVAGHFGTVLFCGSEDGYDIVSLEVMGGSAYLPLGPGYDAKTDTLTIGEITNDPARTSENGDFVGYWAIDPEYPDDGMEPIGVSLRRASVHLAPALEQFAEAQKRGSVGWVWRTLEEAQQ